MKKECISSLQEGDDAEPDVYGYRFGSGEKAASMIMKRWFDLPDK
jgi:hypothetical protein